MSLSKYLPTNISLDNEQKCLVNLLDVFNNELRKKKLFNFFNKNNYKGLYIYGGVGRGKTLIIKAFLDDYKGDKRIYHYQEFCKILHEKIHSINLAHKKDPIIEFSKYIQSLTKVLFIDEIEVRDITDAMFMTRITASLVNLGVIVIFTSNFKPCDLYKNGIQRESFMPFIELIKDKFLIHEVKGANDYRQTKIVNKQQEVILFPNNEANKRKYEEFILTFNNKTKYETKVKVFGREIWFPVTCSGVLFTNFNECFKESYSQNDYIEITKKFNLIVIDFIPIFSPEDSDVIIRFINFIDNAYLNKVLLLSVLEDSPEKLYDGSKKAKEYKRTISRLKEMASNEYILKTKFYN